MSGSRGAGGIARCFHLSSVMAPPLSCLCLAFIGLAHDSLRTGPSGHTTDRVARKRSRNGLKTYLSQLAPCASAPRSPTLGKCFFFAAAAASFCLYRFLDATAALWLPMMSHSPNECGDAAHGRKGCPRPRSPVSRMELEGVMKDWHGQTNVALSRNEHICNGILLGIGSLPAHQCIIGQKHSEPKKRQERNGFA